MSQTSSTLRCPSCQTLNRENAKVCNQCGARLLEPPAPPLITPEPLTRRARERGNSTRRLPAPGFSDLPLGAIVRKQFLVVQILETQPHANSYLVEDAPTARQCLLLESDDPQHSERAQRFLDRGIRHPALVELYDTFQLQYGDEIRAYVVQEFPLSQIAPGNHREIAVLQWGAQIAGALAHLHDKHIAHGNIQHTCLYFSDSQIKLGGYSNLAELEPETAAGDIRQLAQTLYQLAIPLGKTAPLFSPAAGRVIQNAREQRYRDARAFQVDLQQVVDAMRHPARISTTVGRLSDVGRKRELDEDALLTIEFAQFTQAGSPIIGLYAIADGMGGASAGEVASKIVVETLARQVTHKVASPRRACPETELDYARLLHDAVEEANAQVLAARTQAQTDMGSTVVTALLVGNHAHIANVGDSRAYLITSDRIVKLTKDHSLVQALVDRGAIAEADVRAHPQRNYILRNVGDKPDIQVDLFQAMLEPGQSLLLCCDGLWEMVHDEQIHAVVNQYPNPQDACRELVRIANENGGDDNITCIVVRVESA